MGFYLYCIIVRNVYIYIFILYSFFKTFYSDKILYSEHRVCFAIAKKKSIYEKPFLPTEVNYDLNNFSGWRICKENNFNNTCIPQTKEIRYLNWLRLCWPIN